RPLRVGGSAATRRGEGVRAAAAAVGGGADVRLAEALSAAERGPGAVGPVVCGDGSLGNDSCDAQSALPERRRATVPLSDGGVAPLIGQTLSKSQNAGDQTPIAQMQNSSWPRIFHKHRSECVGHPR